MDWWIGTLAISCANRWTGTLAPLVCTKLFLHWSRMAFIVLHKELNTGNLLYDLAPVDDLEVVCA